MPDIATSHPGTSRRASPPGTESWTPRLIATDLDGTFLNSDGEVSERTATVRSALRDKGIPLVGVTGRAPRLVDTVHGFLDGQGYAVLSQGSVVIELSTHAVLQQIVVTAARALELTTRIETVAGPLYFGAEVPDGRSHVLHVEDEFGWPYDEPLVAVGRADLPVAADVLKVYLRSVQHGQDELLALARSVVGAEEAELTHAGLGFIEMSAPGVTKATGLQVVLDLLGIDPADVLALGDMPNDIPMLELAGRSVAMANAHPALLAVADEVTASNNDDGVAIHVERYL